MRPYHNRLGASRIVPLLLALGCGGSGGAERESYHRTVPIADGSGAMGGAGGRGSGASNVAGASDDLPVGSSRSPVQLIYRDADAGVFPTDRVLDVEIAMAPEDWITAIATAEDEQYARASIRIDGQDLGEVGFRFKGSFSLDSCVDDQGQLLCEKLSQKIRFTEFDSGKRFYGLKRLNFNALVSEGNLVREYLAYGLFRDFGIIAPRTSYAVIRVNGKSEGLYHVVEDVDGRFTDDRFEKGNRDGNLYKEGWPDRTDNAYFDGRVATNEETATHTLYQSFAREMLATSDAELPGALSKWVDLNYFVRYMAVDYAIANWDGITTFYCGDWGCSNHNFFMHQEEVRPRFWLIPWDLNATFKVEHWLGAIPAWDDTNYDCTARIPTRDATHTTRAAACDKTIRAIALSRDAYRSAVRELLDKHFVLERLNARIDATLLLLGPAIDRDPYLSPSAVPRATASFKEQIATLRTRLEQVLK